MQNPKLCGEIVKRLKNELKVPITVKIRAGIDNNSINAVSVAQICEQNGASAVTIHGRTKKQMYTGKVMLDIIKLVKESVKIPVIGNGDINSPEDFAEMMNFTGCDMVAIGRGALGNPLIFSQINNFIYKNDIFHIADLCERLDIINLHVKKTCEYKGEIKGMREVRKHLMCYVKGLYNASKLKSSICSLQTKKDFLEFVSQNFQRQE
ncbi:hypothetical protein FACS189465_1740 [Clostridia bacterium]|nr:hypothetical protein FACS189465_1740 [Clostridia bacterium]